MEKIKISSYFVASGGHSVRVPADKLQEFLAQKKTIQTGDLSTIALGEHRTPTDKFSIPKTKPFK